MRMESIDIFETKFSSENSNQQAINFNLKYEDYKRYNEKHLFPERMTVTVKRKLWDGDEEAKPKEEKVRLSIVVDKLEINNEALRFPFHISSKYKRIDE